MVVGLLPSLLRTVDTDDVMSFVPPTGRGRCVECGWHSSTQGHRVDCIRGRCRRCRRFPRTAGRQLCSWCVADDDARRELRRRAVEQRLAELDGQT